MAFSRAVKRASTRGIYEARIAEQRRSVSTEDRLLISRRRRTFSIALPGIFFLRARSSGLLPAQAAGNR